MAGNAAARIARVYDQHAQFTALESDLFCLGLSDTYLQVRVQGAAGWWLPVRQLLSCTRQAAATLPPGRRHPPDSVATPSPAPWAAERPGRARHAD